MDRQEAKDARGVEEPAGEVDAVASSVLQACVEVHRVLGPGFFESLYELALDLERTSRGVPFARQPSSSTSTCRSCFGAFAGSSSLPLHLSDPGVPGVLAVSFSPGRPDCTQPTQTQPIKTSAARD
jgi:hypothetical protein